MQPNEAAATRDPAVTVARELGVGVGRVRAAVRLLADGATVPLAARYRKEATDCRRCSVT